MSIQEANEACKIVALANQAKIPNSRLEFQNNSIRLLVPHNQNVKQTCLVWQAQKS